MLSRFQASYQRVEISLQRLTDSIAAYNPSTTAASELLAADEAVNADLEQLVTHQQNYARITELRAASASLDETIKTTIKLLADTRREIQDISPSYAFSEPRRTVNVADVLSYAKFIAKTTVPPTYRKPPVGADTTGEGSAQLKTTQLGNGSNGIMSSAIGTPDGSVNTTHVKHCAGEGLSELGDTQSSGITGLSAVTTQEQAWLDPAAELPFEPWPSHGVIQNGALAAIQKMVEAGQDPATVMSAEEQAEAERKRAEEEERELAEQRERERRRREAFDAPVRRPTVADGAGGFNPDDL